MKYHNPIKNRPSNYKRNFLLIVGWLLVLSCSYTRQNEITRSFPTYKELIAKKIPVKATLNPVDMLITDDFFVFQNEYISGQPCFFVFDKTMNLRYSFGVLGNGPQEFLAPRLVQGKNKGNHLSIFDSASDKIYSYSLEAGQPSFLSETKILDVMFPTQYISHVNDSIVLYIVESNEGCSLYSYNIASRLSVDTVTFKTPFKDIMERNYNQNLDAFRCSEAENNLVFTFNFIDEVRTGKVSKEGYFDIDREIDQSRLGGNPKTKMTDNIFYYFFPQITSKRIYTQYYGYPFLYMQPFPFNPHGRVFTFLIDVYDLDVNPIARITLDSEILRFVIDEKSKKIYAWDYLSDFDHLLSYDISWLDGL